MPVVEIQLDADEIAQRTTEMRARLAPRGALAAEGLQNRELGLW